MTTHTMKSWSHLFDAIASGKKLHDIRSKKDRTFAIGDQVVLERYDNVIGCYTGEKLLAKITYITSNDTPCAFSSAVLDRDFCVLSLKVTEVVK